MKWKDRETKELRESHLSCAEKHKKLEADREDKCSWRKEEEEQSCKDRLRAAASDSTPLPPPSVCTGGGGAARTPTAPGTKDNTQIKLPD